MRSKKWETNFAVKQSTKQKKEVESDHPGSIVKKVDGGWIVFDTSDDYETWKNQK
jgi:hypothetical protein